MLLEDIKSKSKTSSVTLYSSCCIPYHNVAPLVDLDGQVSVGLDPFSKRGVHHSLARGTNSNGLGQLRLTTPSHPRNLWGKVRNMLLLFLQSSSRHEYREVAVLHTQRLDSIIEERYRKERVLDTLPQLDDSLWHVHYSIHRDSLWHVHYSIHKDSLWHVHYSIHRDSLWHVHYSIHRDSL